MLSCHTGSGSLDTCLTTRESSRPPSGGQDRSFPRSGLASPRRSAECAEHTRARQQRRFRLDYHSPCPDTNAGASPLWAADAQLRWHPASHLAPWCRSRLPQRQRPPAVHQHPQLGGSASRRFSLRLGGSDRQGPPQTGLAHRRISRLPLPVHTTELFAVLNQSCPDTIEDAQLHPPLKGAMHRAVVRVLSGQLVPLAAAPHPKDEGIQCSALVNALATHMLGWVVLVQYGLDLIPQVVWCTPDRWQYLAIPYPSGHDAPPAYA